jgi:IclR family transcriptional regulator, pca regulon regulatory protein
MLAPSVQPGTRVAADATSVGRVMLAGLPAAVLECRLRHLQARAREPSHARPDTGQHSLRASLAVIRDDGYALMDHETEDGLRSAAVPLRAASRRVIAALNVAAYATDVNLRTMQAVHLPRLALAASRVEMDMRPLGPSLDYGHFSTARTRAL